MFKSILIIILTAINLFAQTQTLPNISYTKYTAMHFFGIQPDVNQYSFNSEHDLGNYNVAQYRTKEWVSVYKFSLQGLPLTNPIKRVTVTAYITEKEYDDDCFVATLGLAPNNLTLTDAPSVYNSSFDLITQFRYRDTLNFNMKDFITQQHKQDGYFIIKVFSYCNDLNSMAKISISVNIEYYLPINFTADNNFITTGQSHGSIRINGGSPEPAPKSLTRTVGESVSLTAVSPQTDNEGYQRIWHTGSTDPSYWRKFNSTREFPLQNRYNISYNITSVAEDDYNSTYQGQFRQIRVTTAGSLTTNETWFTNNIALSNNVTVPAGITLNIAPEAEVDLKNYSIISTGGTINVQSGATITGERARLSYNSVVKGICGTIQAAANNAGTSYFINLNSGSFNENVTITNKTSLSISASSGYNQFGTLTLSNCDYFNGSGFGAKSVYLNNTNSAAISHTTTNGINQSTTGYYFYNSDGNGYNLTALNSQAGISCYDGTVAGIQLANLHNNLRGVDSYNGSNVNISNSSFCGTDLDLKAYNFSSIYATSCSFDGGTPSISQSSSTVNVQSSTSCPSAKVTSGGQPGNSIYGYSANEGSPENSEFAQINSAYFDLNKRLVNAINTKDVFNKESYSAEYEELIGKYKKFLEANPASPLAEVALIAAAKSYLRISGLRGKSDAADMKNFLSAFIDNKKTSVLKPAAEKLMIDYYRYIEDYTSAVKTADNLIEKYKKDDDYVCNLLYTKGLIFAHNLNRPDKAIESYSLIMQQYPENPLTALAENELSILGVEVQKNSKPAASSGGTEFSTSNYPNPFNPVTVINYTLPTDENVTIKVYDILGSEIATLVNEHIKAGEHTVSFNAGSLSSGIYFYSITAGKYSKTMKMILAK